jgi:hypothetical protein
LVPPLPVVVFVLRRLSSWESSFRLPSLVRCVRCLSVVAVMVVTAMV